ncbi:aldo/keto reductase [Sinomicrobium pectinilyticum]|uniref:Aldo/keto reductase n=1 Tax=Sinomicrobium pectinilyticum TaxID=1084421 RepID=A0A3N0DYT4_SINP1|nr:aldo/keto reductase [Sinomicrobium pectinilyticum]RNL80747.1 aldo/keto reductase [Sinomicrobium pectinilyticum]
MATRREFITKTTLASAALATTHWSAGLAAVPGNGTRTVFKQQKTENMRYEFPTKAGLGGVAAGNGFSENTNAQITATMQAAWDNGVRYFDTSPWYGLGLSERRMGHFLFEKKREEFVLSTKIGRILEPDAGFTPNPDLLWKGRLNFRHKYDYSADGVRRSVEDSLQRMGLSSIDVVFVHDLSPDNGDLGKNWTEQFKIAEKGAFPELTRMREEGIIKAWGMGVNTPEPILKCLEVADPDVMLVAIQYSLVEHKNALEQVFPAMDRKKVTAVIGGPLNAGFLANRERFNYGGKMPGDMVAKRNKFNAIIKNYNVDLRTVALKFCASHPTVGAVIPGASTAEQAAANTRSFSVEIPSGLWAELQAAKLIEANTPV